MKVCYVAVYDMQLLEGSAIHTHQQHWVPWQNFAGTHLAPLQDIAAYSAIRALNKKGVADAQAYNELCLQMILTSQTVTLCKAFPTLGPIDE